MDNLIRYCCDKGLEHFQDFKFERKSRIVMREHYVSNKNVLKYDLMGYVQMDKYGRCKLPKYFLRRFSNLIQDIIDVYLVYATVEGKIKRRLTLDDVAKMLLNPNNEISDEFSDIKDNLDKDIVRTRTIKIWTIKNKLKR